MPIRLYKCSKCFNEYKSHDDCLRHEIYCMGEQDILNIKFDEVIKKAIEKYNCTFDEFGASIWIDNQLKFISISFSGKLPNGNDFSYFENYLDENFMNSDMLWELIENKISPHLSTEYEGLLCKEHDGYYHIDGTSILEICQLFVGKKVKYGIVD